MFSQYTHLSVKEAVQKLGTDVEKGLSKADASQRLKKYGENKIATKETSVLQIFFRQFKSPFIYLLIIACIIAYFLGEKLDAAFILVFIAINAILGFYQEFKSHQIVKLLKKYDAAKVTVIRDGEQVEIESTSLVPGDIMVIETGDILRADARVVEAKGLKLDESTLTGESEPVAKESRASEKETTQIHAAINIVFSATTVVGGGGKALVIATGKETQIGTVAKLTTQTSHESTFEKEIGKFSKLTLYLIIFTLIGVFLLNLIIKGTTNIFDFLIFSIALAVSVIPEALPVVTTFSLSQGAYKLSKNSVVVKRLSAIEDLGSIEVLCTDKTGTLTENKLEVADVYGDPKAVFFASLASINQVESKLDPFDIALTNACKKKKYALKAAKLIKKIPFDPQRKRATYTVKTKAGSFLVSRGAPEAVLALCSNAKNQEAESWIASQGEEGKRVIAVAVKKIGNTNSPEELEREMKCLGIISFTDPVKDTAIEAVKKAERMGVRVVILTGDRPEVAAAVSKKIGIIDSLDQVITSTEFEKLPAKKKASLVSKINVFARVDPKQKYEIIKLLQANHEVGFLGEGINDAPALKVANVALVVQGASDVAREAADIVLLQKSLAVIVDGIAEGRRVFANTLKYIKSTLTSNFGNFYAVAIASLIINFLPMLPIQILLLNLLSDSPMISIATDTVDTAEVKTSEKYHLRDIAILATALGLVSTVFDFMVFAIFFKTTPGYLQTNWFVASILTELVLIFSIRTRKLFLKAKHPSGLLVFFSLLAATITIVLPLTAFGHRVFKFVMPQPVHYAIIFAIVIFYFATTEAVKLAYYRLFEGRQK